MNIASTKNLISILSGLALALVGGFWWAISSFGMIEAAIFIIGIWALALNNLPFQGLSCFSVPMVKYYYLPLALVSTMGFTYGIFIK